MVLKLPDMLKCTKKCICGYGVNEGVVYDSTDPCPSGPDAFEPTECDCRPPGYAGRIQIMTTSGTGMSYQTNNGISIGCNAWADVLGTQQLTATNARGKPYLHSAFVSMSIFAGAYSSDCFLEESTEWNDNFPGGRFCDLPASCGFWQTSYSTEKVSECFSTQLTEHYVIGRPVAFRFDPDTGERTSFAELATEFNPRPCEFGSGPNPSIINWTSEKETDTCVGGIEFGATPPCICSGQICSPGGVPRPRRPIGYTYELGIKWRVQNPDIDQADFDPLNSAHWIEIF